MFKSSHSSNKKKMDSWFLRFFEQIIRQKNASSQNFYFKVKRITLGSSDK